MTTGGQDTVDYELETWARTILIGSSAPSPYDKVKAYRILTRTDPRSYQARLAKALVSLSYPAGRPCPPQARLPLLEEASAAARAVPPGERRRGDLIADVLGSYQRTLYELGRRAEGLAVRAEMAAASRLAFAAGESSGWIDWSLRTWACGLAEEGGHTEAAAALTELLDLAMGKNSWARYTGERLSLTAEQDAAGDTGAAITTLSTVLDEDRADLAIDRTPPSRVFHTLIWHAHLLDRAGRAADADADRREALGLLRRMAATTETVSWGGSQFTQAGVLLAVQARDAEPHTIGKSRPALGVCPAEWSPDLRERYFAESGITRCDAPADDQPGTLLGKARRESGLPEHATLRRRLAIRTGVYWLWHHGYRFLEPSLPAFDDSVEAARRLLAHSPGPGRPALISALTDRAVLLTAGHRDADALNDYEEALGI
ncbi:hypothetical protein [Actinoplanes sp. NPDC026670]|uniref:hypothetical protein n=1 Tax=Actinoplanes sp. NPDC026670 TaxID=3154700 RepID=UPI0033D058FA